MSVAEIFLADFIQVLLEKLASDDLRKFVRKERRIRTLLKEWARMLEQVEAVVADAEEKQSTDQGVHLWLEDLEDLAYDMDDVLDEFATEALARASTCKVRELIPSCGSCFNPSTLVSDIRMRSKMDEITTRLQDLFNRRMGLGLQNVVVGGYGDAPQRPPTSSLIHETGIFGRDNDKKAIIELLLSDQPSSNKVGVVPIVGMGGIGKTTLAQMVYNDEMINKHFDMKAWVCVAEEFDIIGVTKSILACITSRTWDFQVLDQIQIELKKASAGKKFLIVLDDIWNIKNHSDWNSLKSPLTDGTLGSKVIVTTRNMDVAVIMAGTNKYHFLKELSEDDCWSVFAQYAFENLGLLGSPNLVSIGMKILKKCEGLPLAARMLGGLLRCKLREDKWEEVLNNPIWELSDEESHILPALRLSYYDLPSHLKKCFAYCSILPKDYEFEEKELVFLWMAEGLIRKQIGQKQIEDLGCEYFRELLTRRFFQPSRGELFVMPHLINDLAQFFARKICFRLEDKLQESERDKSINKARHSSYTRGLHDGAKKFEAFHKAENLRTFLPCGSRYQGSSYLTSNVPLRLLPGLRRLRVLSLCRYEICELSSSIGDLKHLRYLHLSCALILMLPESIGTLYNLQTLILRDCKNLSMLPVSTSNLINLRHLDITGADSLQEMPPKIGKLRSLQTLSNYIVGSSNGSEIKELGNLIHLRGTLCISGLEKVVDALDARRANLTDKQGLDVLLMKWSNISHKSRNGSIESKVLDMLRPHENLKKLSIDGYGGLKFPTWVGNSLFSNMVSLKFQNCEKCTSLPPLGHLPSLAKLYVQGMKAVENVGLDFYGLGCSNPFPALGILTFEDMPEWKVWTPFEVEEGAQAFARLQELSIKRCPKLLHELPRILPCIRKLDIQGSPMLVAACSTELNYYDKYDSPVSLHPTQFPIQFPIPDSYRVGDQAVPENSRHSLLASQGLRIIRDHASRPSWFFHGLTGLQQLNLSDCEYLTTLRENEVTVQHRLPALQSLSIKGCPKLISLFAEGEEGDDFKSLPELFISDCPRLISFPKTGSASTLRKLSIKFCNVLQSLPDLTLLNNLEKLDVYFCLSLTHLSSRSGLPPSLNLLSVVHCPKLISLIAEEGMKINCPSLEYIHIISCERLKTLPDMQNNGLRNLRELEIRYCDNLESLPEGWFPATNLGRLEFSRCEKLDPLPNHVYKNNNLTSLYITNVDIDKLCRFCRFCSLTELTLSNCDWVSFPEDGMLSLPSSLIILRIWEFPNLEKLSCKDFEYLIALEQLNISCCTKLTSISELPSLLNLVISRCPNLASFPEQGLPPSLLSLSIRECPKLKQQFEKGKGQYWRFITHIPEVMIDGNFVFDPSS